MTDVKLAIDYVLYQQQIKKANLDENLYTRWLYLKSAWYYVSFFRNKNFMRFHVTEMLKDIHDFFENIHKGKDKENNRVLIVQAE